MPAKGTLAVSSTVPAAIFADLAGQGIHVTVAGSTQSATVDASSAASIALEQDPSGSAVVAQQLVWFAGPVTGGTSALAWAMRVDPAGGFPSTAFANLDGGVAHANYDFEVAFVDATTGRFVMSSDGYAAGLPPEPDIPRTG
ncbi:MAG: hypothetical protein M0Z69_14545 [Actinomycetota bacterium]|nr:hypothetical protein [Actinomycetota bacterium]